MVTKGLSLDQFTDSASGAALGGSSSETAATGTGVDCSTNAAAETGTAIAGSRASFANTVLSTPLEADVQNTDWDATWEDGEDTESAEMMRPRLKQRPVTVWGKRVQLDHDDFGKLQSHAVTHAKVDPFLLEKMKAHAGIVEHDILRKWMVEKSLNSSDHAASKTFVHDLHAAFHHHQIESHSLDEEVPATQDPSSPQAAQFHRSMSSLVGAGKNARTSKYWKVLKQDKGELLTASSNCLMSHSLLRKPEGTTQKKTLTRTDVLKERLLPFPQLDAQNASVYCVIVVFMFVPFSIVAV